MLLTKMERTRLTLNGEKADRIPYSLWTHFPGVDLDPIKLAETTFEFYRNLDLDFIKNMPNGMFSIEDWGCQCDYREIAKGGVAKVTRLAVETVDDWDKIDELDVTQGAFGRELYSLAHLHRLMNDEAPVLVTVFSPLTTAQKLSGSNLFTHMKTAPEKVKRALDVITKVTIQFASQALQMGSAGVFFASQLATYDQLTEDEYAEFGTTYDLKILDAIKDLSWFNVMHIHGDAIMFNQLKEYPVHGISWHVWETDPSVETFLQTTQNTCIVGGLQRFHITDNRIKELHEEIHHMAQLTGGKRLFLAPGCVIRAPVNMQTLLSIKEAIRSTGATRLLT